MEKLIIDRSKWRTGGGICEENKNATGKGGTFLLNDEGFMCCLGFESIRLGAKPEQVLRQASPDMLGIPLLNLNSPNPMYDSDEPQHFSEYADSPFSLKAMQLNDDNSLTSEEREKEIKEHFLTVDIEVEFINEYVKPPVYFPFETPLI